MAPIRAVLQILIVLSLAACTAGGLGASKDSPFAPGLKPNAEAVDGMIVGHRLMAAGQYELALDAFIRAAADRGLTAEVLTALGSANLGLQRLGQSEKLLRRAIATDEAAPEAWNNLGVVLMERGETAEAEQMFKRAYALDNGESDAIRDNLRRALAKNDFSNYAESEEHDFKLVRRGSNDYLIRKVP